MTTCIYLKTLTLLLLSFDIKAQCSTRNISAANAVGRPCREACTVGSNQCKNGTVCKCDHECGFSCIDPESNCSPLLNISHMLEVRVYRNMSGLLALATPPFKYDDSANYTCKPGYKVKTPHASHYCHSGMGWTGRFVCAVSCRPRNSSAVRLSQMICGVDCATDDDCENGFKCRCDGYCGRSCVNISNDCGSAPPIQNGSIKYIGNGFGRMLQYDCDYGFYIESGSIYRRCTGSGSWEGSAASCKRVTCGNPESAMKAMGGGVVRERAGKYYVGDQVTLRCSSSQLLIGDVNRSCLSNGRWDGVDTVCDDIDNTTRCPHPGVPINGNLSYSHNFKIGSIVEFSCNKGYSMIGEKKQECLYFLQWSGGGAPACINPRYPDEISSSFDDLQKSTESLQIYIQSKNLGKSFGLGSNSNYEMFYVFDISAYVNDEDLHRSLKVAKDWLMKVNTGGYVKSAILLFASEVNLYWDLRVSKTSNVLRALDDIFQNRENLMSETGFERNTYEMLVSLNHTLEISFAENPNSNRQVFLFLHGKHTEGNEPQTAIESIKQTYGDDLRQVYVISFGNAVYDNDEFEELQEIAFAFEDRKVLHNSNTLLNSLFTSVQQSQSKENSQCGKAGNVGSVKKQARVGRVIRGITAFAGAWPWQVVISHYSSEVLSTYRRSHFLGGGSLINNKWVLTAAHLFYNTDRRRHWERGIVITLGMNRLPTSRNDFISLSVQVFDAEEILDHLDFNGRTFDYDIALIKIGRGYYAQNNRWKLNGHNNWVNYTSYVRPVCLPCMNENCFAKYLRKTGLLTGYKTDEERCRIEVNALLQQNSDVKTALCVATGFGHVDVRDAHDQRNARLSEYMKQNLLKLVDKKRCSETVDNDIPLQSQSPLRFTERMICAVSGVPGEIIDTCQGDSGGPIVREVYDRSKRKSCWVQIGIISWGWGCGTTYKDSLGQIVQFPGFYTNISSLIGWIRFHTDECRSYTNKLEEGRTCRKPCRSDADCRGRKKRCRCDDVCGMSCFNPNALCLPVPPVANGIVKQNERKYGGKVSYSCNDGYTLNGTAQRQCRSDRKWSGLQPTCVKIKVPMKNQFCTPILIENGTSSCSVGLKVGSICKHTCNDGYILVGNNSSRCIVEIGNETTKWHPILPHCQNTDGLLPSDVILCTTKGNDPGILGSVFTITCPSGCAKTYLSVYGNRYYTGGSSICKAAVHDGRITDDGGQVTIYRQPGQLGYRASTRNSILSRSSRPTKTAFSFTPDIVKPKEDDLILCGTTADDPGLFGKIFTVNCPFGCVSTYHSIYGNRFYTSRSSICKAAIHDGRITDAGGMVTVYKQTGQPSYRASQRNSITSRSFGVAKTSFSFTLNISKPNEDDVILCSTTSADPGLSSSNFTITCPSGCTKTYHSIYGNRYYTGGSSICKAALHDGRITDSGGKVTVYKQTGQRGYRASVRNSITSRSSGPKRNSFSFTPTIIKSTDDPIPCTSFADDDAYIGSNFTVTCPTNCAKVYGSLYGNRYYTGVSPICKAAIHDGRITDDGGKVTVYRHPGQQGYLGSVRNSVTSFSRGPTQTSFSFTPDIAQPSEDDVILCKTTGDDRGLLGRNFTITCPPGCARKYSSIYGNRYYTGRSSICKAAIHDGRIKDAGGKITVYRQPGHQGYRASERNSITSRSSGSTTTSFSFTSKTAKPSEDDVILCTTTGDDRGLLGRNFTITCPPGCARQYSSIYGNKCYTGRSSICKAAIHDGRISDNGGKVTVFRQFCKRGFRASTRNSITSRSSGPAKTSFSITSKTPETSEDDVILCTTTGDDRGLLGRNFTVTCPPGCARKYSSIYGNRYYTGRSSICKAAIHDGRIKDDGGKVTVYRHPGQQGYLASLRNSITSRSSGSSRTSFSFTPSISQSSEDDLILCSTTGDNRGLLGQNFTITCPRDCARLYSSIYGNRYYTSSSSICKAAIHDGRITNAGGKITVYRQPGHQGYRASERNSITSRSSGSTTTSFSFTSNIPKPSEDDVILCTTLGNDRGLFGHNFTITCPRGCARKYSSIYGNICYTGSSFICKAAIHDGRITDVGGKVTVFKQSCKRGFRASTRNSITSRSSGPAKTSFSFTSKSSETSEDDVILCTTTGDDRGLLGRNFTVTCPRGCARKYSSIYGNRYYTGRSSICKAAVHDGRITDDGGKVTVYRHPGQQGYLASLRNSITSRSSRSTGTSFSFTPNISQPSEDDVILCTTTGDDRGLLGRNFTITCPPGCARKYSSIYGNRYYTGRSSICKAAVHDGRITDAGGKITVYRQPGHQGYRASERNSITSRSSGSTTTSFSFTSTIAQPSEDDVILCTTTGDDRGLLGRNFTITCPPGCARKYSSIYGNRYYTSSSSICKAAIHDGRITGFIDCDIGGKATVYRHSGRQGYLANTRNSITSRSSGSTGTSFSFTPTIAQPSEDDVILCTTTGDDRGLLGRNFTVTCPPGCARKYSSIYGNRYYTGTSPICKAAIHDERITDDGGKVTVFRQSGQQSYRASKRNLITSRSSGPTKTAFSFTSKTAKPSEDDVILCTTTGDDRGLLGRNFTVTCPPGCSKIFSFIYGNRYYTGSSSICKAAIHDDRLTDIGSKVTVYRHPGQPVYRAAIRNSIVSRSSGPSGTSFSFTPYIVKPTEDDLIFCTTTGDDRGLLGRNFTITCPPGCARQYSSIYGNRYYTGRSAICKAAIHDGRITDTGGKVTVYRQSGQRGYRATARNSITSRSRGRTRTSFSFTPNIVAPTEDDLILCTTNGDDRGLLGSKFTVTCPSGCSQIYTSIYGNGYYTGRSPICKAAIHDGRITDAGGKVNVIRKDGRQSYSGTKRNGVSSRSYRGTFSSFKFL